MTAPIAEPASTQHFFDKHADNTRRYGQRCDRYQRAMADRQNQIDSHRAAASRQLSIYLPDADVSGQLKVVE